MTKEQVLSLLLQAKQPLSGEQMSRTLGVSRAAVWKAIGSLRLEGYTIEAATRRGYRLTACPSAPDALRIAQLLSGHPWCSRVRVLEQTDSTNNEIKRLAAAGAPEGTCVVALRQTAGRGRRGRSFLSPEGGLYMSVLLRPALRPEALMPLTAMTAVAAMRAVEQARGLRPGIKWTNDLVVGRRKLCGILTELSIEAESQAVDYVVIGIGINCSPTQFPPELAEHVTDLQTQTGRATDRSLLAAKLLTGLYELEQALPEGKDAWLRVFSENCVTLGQAVSVVRGDQVRHGHADGIDENAALRVRYDDGSCETVSSGEVSVRGMYGYV